jgi:hypothetical protein
MTHVNKSQALIARIGRLFLVCAIVPASYSRPLSHAAGENLTANTATASGPQLHLDIALYGPFAVVDCAEGGRTIRLVAPNVPLHEPVKVGKAELKRGGKYSLLHVPAAKTTELINPVKDAEALIFPVEDVCPGVAKKPCPYVCIDLPRPTQIVPWDADPIRVLKPGENPATIPWTRLARVLVLRYEVSSFQGIQLSRADETWNLEPEPRGTEGILLADLEPFPQDGDQRQRQERERQASRDTFQVLIGWLGLRGHIEFPDDKVTERFHRNQPLTQGLLPKELIDWLDKQRGQKFGTRNDCIVGSALVVDVLPQ